jgi:hypothetical protein
MARDIDEQINKGPCELTMKTLGSNPVRYVGTVLYGTVLHIR